MVAVFDGHAAYTERGDHSLITFGDHQLVLQKDWLIFDDGNLKVAIPQGAKKIEIHFERSILNMSADGNQLLNTPINLQ